jgi:3'-phosphoadenosine 5'-phosphosulfate sulfotransferase (PAPS reductase)/FAD synthetase
MPTKEELKYLQAMPLDIKIGMTQNRIREWVREYGTDGVYVSFSGGKDSTVLLHIVREMYPSIEAVFVNTGLEYPEIQKFVKTFDNVTILRPKMRFDEVIKKYGYPIISKSVSNCVRGAKMGQQSRINLLNGLDCDGTDRHTKFSKLKYKPLLDVDFEISDMCCDVMKKSPSYIYQRKTGKVPILATMAAESMLREKNWIKHGCNAFDAKHKQSAPMSFWTEQDVLHYIKKYNVPVASVYGQVQYATDPDQIRLEELGVDCECATEELITTGCDRTGCIFCAFGCHLEKEPSRFQRLKETHPRQYDYCINGGEYDENGVWKPNKKGLGLGHVFDELNKIYGDDFIKY